MNRERLGRRLVELQARLHDLESGTPGLRFCKRIAAGLLALTVALGLIFWGFIVHQGDIKGMTAVVVFVFGLAIWFFGSALGRVNENGIEDLRERIGELENQVETQPAANG